MRYIVQAILLLWSLCCISVQAQTIIYVPLDGTGDGSSWGQASNLADAVSDASAGDQIWLMQGVYEIECGASAYIIRCYHT